MNHFVRNLATATFAAFLLSACLTDEVDANKVGGLAENNDISGSVGDGPTVGATIRVFGNDGTELAQLESDTTASYNISVQANSSDYALRLESTGGTDLVTNLAPDFQLTSAVSRPGNRTVANLNPFSTFAVALAQELPGGPTAENLENAQDIVSERLNSGLTTLAITGPMTTHIDEHNIAEMVKASETLAEVVRRVRDLMQNAGYAADGDAVVAALSSDLTDEVIDGLGGSRADARIAAVTTLVYAQVLMESMANQLHVNGTNATVAMDNAIEDVALRTPTALVGDQVVTSGMVDNARIGLAAAFVYDSDNQISDLHDTVTGLQPGMEPTLVRTLLPADYRTILQNALASVANADTSDINTINDIARNGGEIPSGNRAPSIQGTPDASVEVGSQYSFTPTANDPDDDTLTFDIANLPAWANFNASTGALTGTPTAGDVGTYSNIVISVSDGEFSADLAPFSIEVFEGNVAPTISGDPTTTVVAGSSYVFQPSASDPNGDNLTFSIANQPSWAAFNPTTGRLSGMPGENDVGTDPDIVISVSDGSLSDSLPAFTITVETAIVPNTPPEISGNPPGEVNAGDSYAFTPTASDADGDNLSFSIANQPSWATFSTSNGSLTGTPGDGDVGTYSNIRITVSDGTDTASIQFSITVNAVSLGSVTLTWTAPTQNEDGSALTDLAGYKLYWGTTSGVYPNSVTLDNPSLTTYVVDNLVPGTYEFVATSFNDAGVESRYSGAATKVVQ